ncbi:MAG: hypothetical protein AB1758_08270, partial [Candidatus Eremiobacterota bacterium]
MEFQEFFPLYRCMDLVRAPQEVAAAAVLQEVTRFAAPDPVLQEWRPFRSLPELWNGVSEFTNCPTQFFVLATDSPWSVVWTNAALCDGYDSLSWCLTENHGLTTLHFFAAEQDSTFQAGCGFTHRGQAGERSVYCCRN